MPHAVPLATESIDFRSAMAMFATGVTIVTACAPDGAPVGLTANSFNSVSLQPPLVLWSLACQARSQAVFQAATHYVVHVLGAHQHALAQRFAARDTDRFANLPDLRNAQGVPLLDGCVARFECRSRSRYTEGDHVIFVGEVMACQQRCGVRPLLYHGGRFYTEHPL